MKFKQNPPDSPDELLRKSMRDRILPAAAMVGDRSIPEVETAQQPEGDYEEDLKKLKTLTKNKLRELLNQVEDKSREDQGLFSKGDLLNGYAIDKETSLSLQSSNHNGIDFELAKQISEELRSIDNYDSETSDIDYIKYRRIVKGMVYLQVPGFKTPIVRLYLGLKAMGNEVPKEDIDRIVDHLKLERSLLPISGDCSVL